MFYFDKRHKNSGKGKTSPLLLYQAFPQNKSLCVAQVLDEYADRAQHFEFFFVEFC